MVVCACVGIQLRRCESGRARGRTTRQGLCARACCGPPSRDPSPRSGACGGLRQVGWSINGAMGVAGRLQQGGGGGAASPPQQCPPHPLCPGRAGALRDPPDALSEVRRSQTERRLARGRSLSRLSTPNPRTGAALAQLPCPSWMVHRLCGESPLPIGDEKLSTRGVEGDTVPSANWHDGRPCMTAPCTRACPQRRRPLRLCRAGQRAGRQAGELRTWVVLGQARQGWL